MLYWIKCFTKEYLSYLALFSYPLTFDRYFKISKQQKKPNKQTHHTPSSHIPVFNQKKTIGCQAFFFLTEHGHFCKAWVLIVWVPPGLCGQCYLLRSCLWWSTPIARSTLVPRDRQSLEDCWTGFSMTFGSFSAVLWEKFSRSSLFFLVCYQVFSSLPSCFRTW